MSELRPIIVPWDFSELSEYALEHAINIAKIVKCDIFLVHIIKKQSDLEAAEEKLIKFSTEVFDKYGIKPLYIIKEGSIFTEISDIIDEKNAFFAVMGTHGIKGMQKFTGSWALKVIAGSKAPFIVVQAPPAFKELKNIVFPVDFKFSEKEKLLWAEFISRFFNSKFHLCYIDVSDPSFKKKINSNILLAKKYLTDKEVDFEIVKLDGKIISDSAVEYAKAINADMIMISTTKNISFQDYVLGASEQKIIANKEKVPVMTVNPRADITKTGGLT
jgi:nucleotide-binding universal stress UspA family protein